MTATHDPDRQRVNTIAAEAIERIDALGLALDPGNFELWFAYCARSNSALNSAVNELLAARSRPEQREWEKLVDQFVSPRRFAGQLRGIGRNLHERTSEIAEAVQQASGSARGYGGALANAFGAIQRTESRDQLRSTVAALLETTAQIQKTNAGLQEQLSASAIQIRRLQERLETVELESMRDPLTGVANRRLFDESLARMIATAEAQDVPMSLLLIDVDNFKMFNDRHGHMVGDDVLRLVSAAIRQNCRSGDIVCRYGGDEFAVLLPQTPVQGALVVAENIRRDVRQRELLRRSTHETLGRLTLSIGLSEHQKGQSAETLIERADTWLLAAKRNGRDRIERDGADRAAVLDVAWGRCDVRLVWHEDYECGNATIDNEHRELFELANALLDRAADRDASPRDVMSAVDALLAHVAGHFADEEAELSARRYVGLARHQAAHARLLADAGQLRDAFQRGSRTLTDLREFLVNSVVAGHMFGADREFYSLFRDATVEPASRTPGRPPTSPH